MSSSLSDTALEKKFQGATNTQDSIQALSLWLLHHKTHHQKIVAAWMKVLQKDDLDFLKINRLLDNFLCYVKEVIQCSSINRVHAKSVPIVNYINLQFIDFWKLLLLVRDEHIRSSILRVFDIWEQRSIYSPAFIADLRAILANSKVPSTAESKLLADFKPETVINKK
ncbi:hypothetical protein CEXT_238681 [Caerostris extrusa]|uniref:CID domain-containing protein n=1 Tax=Caerostris extrusa TaxID=172846 RepID=A0AAV4PEE7_CAEEX|nr:hypothetical protein CEXT_238681 [Caerostris extrusa]